MKYTKEIAETICARIAAGEAVSVICKTKGLPARSTFYMWVDKSAAGNEVYAGLAEAYSFAMSARTELMAEEILAISDGKMPAIDVPEESAGERNQRDRLRVDTRKWLMAKMQPKKYGDKMQHGGADDLPAMKTEIALRFVSADDGSAGS
jgi:hypothetical protein